MATLHQYLASPQRPRRSRRQPRGAA
jgi:hypothetical protein